MSHTRDSIKLLLSTNDEAVKRAIAAITARQTSQEVRAQATIDRNGRGWNGLDAKFMTSLAAQLLVNNWLSPRQLVVARRKLMKYAGQLLAVIAEKAVQS
jgi:hypothetical protein